MWDLWLPSSQKNAVKVMRCHSMLKLCCYIWLYIASELALETYSWLDEVSAYVGKIHAARSWGQPVARESGIQLTARHKSDLSFLQPQGNKFCHQSEYIWKQILPQPTSNISATEQKPWLLLCDTLCRGSS